MVTPGIDALGSRADRDVNLSLVAEAGFFACPKYWGDCQENRPSWPQ
jgi:hypothetical protein